MPPDSDDTHSEPPAKRPRAISKACETCKLRKSRCDSGRPQCEPCRRRGVACVYREKGQPGLRPGYGKALESRLSVLETNVASMTQSVHVILQHVRGPGNTLPVLSPAHTDVPDTSAWPVPDPVPDPVQEPVPSPLWPAQPESQPLPESHPLPDVPPFAPIRSLSADSDDSLPPRPVVEELVDLFFDLVYPWAPLFFRPAFSAGLYAPDRQLLLHGIVVVAMRFRRSRPDSSSTNDAYVRTSRDRILLATVDTCTLVSTQALALLAIDAVGQGQGPRTWNVLSMLVCAARHLGLSRGSFSSSLPSSTPLSFPPSQPSSSAAHSSPPSTPLVRNEDPDDALDPSGIEAEERRRLFWVIYAVDRLSSVSHGQLGGIDTKSIRLPYPVDDRDWGQPVAPEWFRPIGERQRGATKNLWRHTIDLLAMVDRSNQLLVQPVDYSVPVHCREWQANFRRLDAALSDWFDALPAVVRDRPARFDPAWVMMQSTLYLINIRMYTVAAFPSTTSPYLRPSAAARVRCRRAIADASALAASLDPADLDRLGPAFAFTVWVAARSLVILWTSGFETSDVSSPSSHSRPPADLDPLLACLRHMSAAWPCARRYADLLRLIVDAARSGSSKNDPAGPAALLDVFNDTRRTAYGLQSRLGALAGGHPAAEAAPPELDFLDMPLLDADWGAWGFLDGDGDWLGHV